MRSAVGACVGRLAPILGRIRRLERRGVGLAIAILALLPLVGLLFLLDARDAGDGPPVAADVLQEPATPVPEPSAADPGASSPDPGTSSADPGTSSADPGTSSADPGTSSADPPPAAVAPPDDDADAAPEDPPSAEDDEAVSAAPEQDVGAATDAAPATIAEDDDEPPPTVAAADASPAAEIASRPRFAAPEPTADAAPPRFAQPPPDPIATPRPVAEPPPDPVPSPRPVAAPLPELELAPPDLPVTQPLGILAPAITERLAALPNGVGITTIDLRRDLIFTHHAGAYYDLASVAKVPLMLAVLQEGEREERTLSRREQVLLELMIHTSSNEAANALWQDAVNAVPGLLSQLDVWPGILVPGGWGLWTGNAYGVAQVFREIVAGESLSEDVRHDAMRLLAGVAPWQRWGISAGLPEGAPAWRSRTAGTPPRTVGWCTARATCWTPAGAPTTSS